ncbi:MAG: sigma-70 family RNA polymerase sigma factor [Actinobacteria bacterium]|nr:sigma-70 family RNA polymerase sigma factor [Actinomycetota bacterium]
MEEPASERAIVERLRAGDELAFQELVRRHHNAMVRFAETFVPSRAIAEEVAQEAWLGVIKGIDRFEGRSALSTWIFRIVANIGRTRGERERRTVATVSLSHELAEAGPSVPPSRFSGPTGRGAWAHPPAHWSDLPDERLMTQSTFARVGEIAAGLSENQRRVFVLRDIQGWSPAEVCGLLDLSEVNQRVLLHRARSRVRAALENDLGVPS